MSTKKFSLLIALLFNVVLIYFSYAMGSDLLEEDAKEIFKQQEIFLLDKEAENSPVENILLAGQGRHLETIEDFDDFLTEETKSILDKPDNFNNPLIPFIRRYIIDNQQTESSLCFTRLLNILKVFAVFYGATGGIPYISPCCKAARGNNFLCVSFASGNVISSGGATIWAGLKIVNSFDPISDEEKEIRGSRKRFMILKHFVCNFLGLVSCITGTYSVYKYNDFKLLVIPGFLNNYIFSTAGYYEALNPNSLFQRILNNFYKKDEVTHASNQIKEATINQVQNHVIPSIVINGQERNNLFTKGQTSADDIESANEFIKKLFLFNYPSNTEEPPEVWKRGYPRKLTIAISFLFPVGSAIVNYLLNYDLASIMFDSPIVCHLFATVPTIPNFMLDVLSSTTTAGDLFDTIYNFFRGRNAISFTTSIHPSLKIIIPMTAVTLACLSVTGGWTVSTDIIHKYGWVSSKYFFASIVYISNTVSQSFQVRDLIYKAVTYGCSKFRLDKIGDIASKIRKLDKFTDVISNCVPSFIYNLRNHMKKE